MMKSIDKFYVSDIDKSLAKFDATHKNSAAQQAEINKYKEIYKKRDQLQPKHEVKHSDLWDEF